MRVAEFPVAPPPPKNGRANIRLSKSDDAQILDITIKGRPRTDFTDTY